MNNPLYRTIANQVRLYHSATDDEWRTKHENALEKLMQQMPSGSGIDSGTKLLLAESSENKLVFLVEYHHVNSNGYYCGWSSRNIVITASLTSDFDMDMVDEDSSGADMTDVDEETGEEYDNSEFILDSTGDHLADTYRWALQQPYELTLADYKPTKLTWHGELVRS